MEFQYTTEEDYKKILNVDFASELPYSTVEDIAVMLLSQYSISFPSVEEWRQMKIDEPFAYDRFKKAIVFQMKYLLDNPEVFYEAQSAKNYKVGRIALNKGSMTKEQVQENMFSPIAIGYLEDTGYVVHELCQSYDDICSDGCWLM